MCLCSTPYVLHTPLVSPCLIASTYYSLLWWRQSDPPKLRYPPTNTATHTYNRDDYGTKYFNNCCLRYATTYCLHAVLITDEAFAVRKIKTIRFRRIRKIAKRDYYFRHVCTSFRLHGTARLPLEVFFMKFDIWIFRKFRVSIKSDKDNGCFTRRLLCIYDNSSLISS
jgi:hypothetical protein